MKTWFLNLKTGTKIQLAFSAALAIAILVGIAGLVNIEAVHREATHASSITRGAQFSLLKFRSTAVQAERSLFPGDPGDRTLTAEETKAFADAAEARRHDG